MSTINEMKAQKAKYQRTWSKTTKGKDVKRRYKANHKKLRFREFIAWDGEGYNKGGKHIYALLMNSVVNRDTQTNTQQIVDLEGISTVDAFNFLCETGKAYPDAVHIIFSGSYDCNMILKDIARKPLKRLHETGRLYWRNFSLEYHPKKYLEIKRYKPNTQMHKTRGAYDCKIVLWDVFGFFQSSFIKALDTFFSLEEKAIMGYDRIVEGKNRRSTFDASEVENFIIPYTAREVHALVYLMSRLYNEHCHKAGIALRRFDGAGAIAHAVLTSRHVKAHYGEIPHDATIAAQGAYGGGRIELLQYGHIETIPAIEYNGLYRVDVRSGYPSIMVDLPSLLNALWKHTTSVNMLTLKPYSFYRITWDYRNESIKPFYPFFYRSYQGAITFPYYGSNWVCSSDLEAALKWNDFFKGNITIHEAWELYPSTDIKPFAFVVEMYELRRKLKEIGDGMEQVLKLAYNSFYGKLVQHLGYEDHKSKGEKDWRPPFFNLVYGAHITAGIRSKVFDAAMQYPYDTIGFATDGIFTTHRLELDYGSGLGQWELEQLASGTFVQSGVYWLHDLKGKVTAHYRGFDKDALTEDMVLNGWRENKESINVPSTRFITLGQGLASTDKDLWCTWHTMNRELKLNPIQENSKRASINSMLHVSDRFSPMPLHGLIPTIPYSFKVPLERGKPLLSEPFPLPWSSDRQEYDTLRSKIVLEREIVESIEEKYE